RWYRAKAAPMSHNFRNPTREEITEGLSREERTSVRRKATTGQSRGERENSECRHRQYPQKISTRANAVCWSTIDNGKERKRNVNRIILSFSSHMGITLDWTFIFHKPAEKCLWRCTIVSRENGSSMRWRTNDRARKGFTASSITWSAAVITIKRAIRCIWTI